MSILLVAVAWLLLGVIFCLVSGRGIALGDTMAPEPTDTPPAPAEARTFTTLAVHEWALAAHTVATDKLLSTRPGVIRRVAAK